MMPSGILKAIPRRPPRCFDGIWNDRLRDRAGAGFQNDFTVGEAAMWTPILPLAWKLEASALCKRRYGRQLKR